MAQKIPEMNIYDSKRRSFVKKTSLSLLGLSLLGSWPLRKAQAANKLLKVNEKRIEARISELAKFGQDAAGHGYRMAFTKGNAEAQAWLLNLMQQAQLNCTIDAAGNIIGIRKGKKDNLKPISFGSHIDMVPDGGNYDGTLGSLAALEVIEILNENKITTNHPLEVIIFADEEGSMVGSKALTSIISAPILAQKSHTELTVAEGVKVIKGNPENLDSCLRQKGDIHAFLELHIEQGGVLEKEEIEIGIVEGIVGIEHWAVTVEGFANHAGTTPMSLRQDALLAASKFIIAVNEVIRSVDGAQVGTIGKIEVHPGAYNVIPGKASLGLEIRDLSAEKVEKLYQEIEKRAEVIAAESQVKISFERMPNVATAALTDKNLQQSILKSAQNLGLSTKFMPSGAGHDSQNMARIAPIAMIFVPSIGGISHSHKEFTKSVDMANGASVLLNTILEVDKS
jgi:N-carbamoyl-L-amino-acid hydrolase